MPGRNADEAFRDFLRPFRRACLAVDQGARLISKHVAANVYVVTTGVPGLNLARPGKPEQRLYLSMTLESVPHDGGQMRMSTRRYVYELSESGSTLLGWHWHPASKRASQITWPHLHMPKASKYAKAHVPTGRVALEDLLLFLINDMGAVPDRDNASAIIEETSQVHKAHRGWS